MKRAIQTIIAVGILKDKTITISDEDAFADTLEKIVDKIEERGYLKEPSVLNPSIGNGD